MEELDIKNFSSDAKKTGKYLVEQKKLYLKLFKRAEKKHGIKYHIDPYELGIDAGYFNSKLETK